LRNLSRGQARQYARALLAVAEERGGDEVLRIRDELRELSTLTGTHRGLRAALDARGVTLADRGRALAAIADSAGASPLVSRLLGVLAGNDHLALLPPLAEVYASLANAARGIVPVEATAAVDLSAEQEVSLRDVLTMSAGGEVELTTEVDPAALGGMRVKMGGRTYDGTVRARLRALRGRLASGS
jgi:F-type H+-transporting ATPase subunit delta